MSTITATDNKATFRRFHDAVNAGDEEVISKTIDEVVEPDVQIRTPLPVEATGAEALKEVWATLLRGFPDVHVDVQDVIAEGTRSLAGRSSPERIRANTWGFRRPATPSRTTRSSSSALSMAESQKPGASSMSSRRCGNSAQSRLRDAQPWACDHAADFR
jgi:hypothetical protein